MAFSYEEIRGAAVEALVRGTSTTRLGAQQWKDLVSAVRRRLYPRPPAQGIITIEEMILDEEDSNTLREIFWELFRQGYVTLGFNDSNPGWPFFQLSRFGRKALTEGAPYNFTDSSTYLAMIRRHVPDMDDVTEAYLNEAVQAFHAGCILASNVMLGVAAENRFNRLVDSVVALPQYERSFQKTKREVMAARRITEFRKGLDRHIDQLPADVREDIDARFSTIQAVIRQSRNESGHPTGKAPDREYTYVLLQLFAPLCHKLWQIQDALIVLAATNE